MGRKTRGIYASENGSWEVDKYWKGERLRQRGFLTYEEAEKWLIKELEIRRRVHLHGERAPRTFDDAAAHYVTTHQKKTSLPTEIILLESVMPYIGELQLQQVHDGTLQPYVQARLRANRKHKTINLALGVVRRILNLAADTWRDEAGQTWLERAPKITMLDLVGYQREPRPISWEEQRKLLPLLPPHLERMALFTLNTGVRDDVACNLRWEWEIPVPELGISVFEVPRRHVKGQQIVRAVVCNTVAQSVIESCRGRHPEFVFVWRRERVKNLNQAPAMGYQPVQSMNNTAWQNARRKAGLGDLHVHDLRHTVGMRLREAGVAKETRSEVLWHGKEDMTDHYSLAQIVELHGALEKIKDDSGTFNKSLHTLRLEHQARLAEARLANTSPPEVPQQRKTA